MQGGLWASLGERQQLRWFGAASLVAFGLSYWVGITGQALRTAASPFGIVSLELAGTAEAAQRIHAAWGATGREAAAFNIRIDFLYLLAYGIALSIGCAVASTWWGRRSARMASLGPAMSLAMLLAAGCDAVENVAMLLALRDPGNALWPMLARVCAMVKFALLPLGLLYVMTGAFTRIGTRNQPAPAAPRRS